MAPLVHAGRFDARFLGVMMIAANISELESFRLTDRNVRPDMAILERLDTDPFISDVSRLTVIDHETRHFHDSLLYPFGATLIRKRAYAAVNGLTVGVLLRSTNPAATVLPIPLTEWLRKPLSQRELFIRRQENYLGRALIPPELPVVGDDGSVEGPAGFIITGDDAETIVAGSRAVSQSYNWVEGLWRAPHTSNEEITLPTSVMWEVPAILCQAAAVARATDASSGQRFVEWMLREAPPLYRNGVIAVESCLGGRVRARTWRDWLALAAWSQMGRFYEELQYSSPLRRLDRLWNAVQSGLRWSFDAGFLDLVRRWDESTDTDSIAALHDSTASLDRLIAHWAGSTSDKTKAKNITESALRAFHKAHIAMKRAFFSDPDAYVDPVEYDRRRSGYPQPALAGSYTAIVDGETRHEWLDMTPPDWQPSIASEVALDFGALVDLTDALYLSSDQTLQPGGAYIVRKYFGLEPVRLIEW